MLAPHSRIADFAAAIRALPMRDQYSRIDLLRDEFRLHKEQSIQVFYAPVDFVNPSARVVLLGITPGWTQMEIAYRVARAVLLEDSHDLVQACRAVKEAAAFAGSMRRNLCKMLDELGLASALGICTSQDLFGDANRLLHSTSVLRYPVFVCEKNYTGHSPKILSRKHFRSMVESQLQEELACVPGALVVPLGYAAEAALSHLVTLGCLEESRCLVGFPHPSGANGYRVAQFRARKRDLSAQMRRFLA